MTYGYIYKISNIINNKIYIGQAKDVEKRYRQHLYQAFNNNAQGYNNPIHRALRKYGVSNFKVEIIDSAENSASLNSKEIEWIKKLDTRNYNIGYNITPGGEGNSKSADFILINDGIKAFWINKIELDYYLEKGYYIGAVFNTKSDEFKLKQQKINLNKKFMYKDDTIIRVNIEEVDNYLRQGYALGQKPKVAKQKKTVPGDGPKKYMTLNGERLLVPETKQAEYLANGWVFGGTKKHKTYKHKSGYKCSAQARLNMSKAHLGKCNSKEAIQKQADKLRNRIVITNGEINKLIDPADLDNYLKLGWVKGRTAPANKRNRKVICYETQQVFNSITEASRAYPKCNGLKRCLKSKPTSICGGYHWYFADDLERSELIKEAIESDI